MGARAAFPVGLRAALIWRRRSTSTLAEDALWVIPGGGLVVRISFLSRLGGDASGGDASGSGTTSAGAEVKGGSA